MVRTLGSLCTEDQVQPLVQELRSQKLFGVGPPPQKKKCFNWEGQVILQEGIRMPAEEGPQVGVCSLQCTDPRLGLCQDQGLGRKDWGIF